MIGAGNKTKSSTGGQLIRMESPLRTVISSVVVVLLPAGIGLFQGRSRLQDVSSRIYLALPAKVKACEEEVLTLTSLD